MQYYFRALRYLWPFKWLIVLVLFSSVMVSVFNAGTIGGMKPLVDVMVGEVDMEKILASDWMQTDYGQMLVPYIEKLFALDKLKILIWMAVGLVVIGLSKNVFRVLQEYLSAYITARATMTITFDVHSSVMNQSLGFFTRMSVGEIMSRVGGDVGMISGGFRQLFQKLFQESLNVVALLGVLFFLNWRLAILSLAVLPLCAFIVSYFNKKIQKKTRKSMEKGAQLASSFQESLYGIRVVKAFAMEEYEKQRFQKQQLKLFRMGMRIAKAGLTMTPLVEVLGMVGVVIFLIIGGRDIMSGRMSTGSFVAFYAALASLYPPIKKLTRAYTSMKVTSVAAQRVFNFMDRQPEIVDRPGAQPLPKISRGISFEKVGFSYDGHTRVLHDFSLNVKHGEIIALVGPSGAGKSTLINLIPRFYDVTEGAIKIDSFDIRDVTVDSLRKQISMVSQETVLFNETIRYNICYGHGEFSDAQVAAAAKTANAHDFIVAMPEGYDTVVGERGLALSGGQRQRITIARALIRDAPILVLDEATSELDAESEHLIKEALYRLMEERTTFVIAHRFSTVKHADRIVVLNEGRIEAIGTHSKLVTQSPTYRFLYQHQFESVPTAAIDT